jgi:macrolide-specific efflux system membrane fusion protein
MRRLRFAALILLIALAVAGAYWLWPSGSDGEWMTAEVERSAIEDVVTASGTLQPRDYVDVGTQVSGQLMKLHVDVGAQVEAGALLAEIDPAVYLSRVEASRAQLRNQRAQLQDRRAQLILAEHQYERQQNLMREDASTIEALQSAEATLLSVQAQIEALTAQIEQTESSLRGDEASLGYTKIYAPMSGTVVSLSARQGQTLNANQQAPIVLRIADLSVMTVQTQVSEADVGKLKLGMDVYFTTLGNREQRFYGKLRQILPTPEVLNNVVLYNALFDVPNPGQTLMTQMTAQVFFVLAAAEDALIVPITAVTPASRSMGEPRAPGAGFRPDGQRQPGAGPAGAGPRPAGQGPAGGGPGMRNGAPAGERPMQRRDGQEQREALRSFATVRVLDARGRVEERRVELGVSNRVSVQLLGGVEAGEQVIIGSRRADGMRGAAEAPRFPPPGPRL